MHKEKTPPTLLSATYEDEAGQIYEGAISAYKNKDLIHTTQENDKKLLGLGDDFNTKFFRTKDGVAYGFVKDGKIFIAPRIAGADTPIHEYTHLWAEGLRKSTPEAWEQLIPKRHEPVTLAILLQSYKKFLNQEARVEKITGEGTA